MSSKCLDDLVNEHGYPFWAQKTCLGTVLYVKGPCGVTSVACDTYTKNGIAMLRTTTCSDFVGWKWIPEPEWAKEKQIKKETIKEIADRVGIPFLVWDKIDEQEYLVLDYFEDNKNAGYHINDKIYYKCNETTITLIDYFENNSSIDCRCSIPDMMKGHMDSCNYFKHWERTCNGSHNT